MEPQFTLGMSIPAAAALGALHVLEPAHGRSIFHAFLVGSKRSIRSVVVFGAVVMLTHTAVALIIALLLGIFGAQMAEHRLTPIAQLLGSGITLVLGFRMWAHGRRHAKQHEEEHAHSEEACEPPADTLPKVWTPVSLGFSGGLIPCYGSIAFIGLWMGHGMAVSAVLPVIAFGAGLSITLIIAGAAAAKSSNSALFDWFRHRLGHWSDFAASAVVITLGLIAAVMAINAMR